MTNKTKIAGLVGAALLLCGAQAQAEITYYSWTFNSPSGESGTLGNTVSKTSGTAPNTVTATAQAWSNTNNGTAGSVGANGYNTDGTVNNPEVTAINNYTLETAYLNVYGGGLGVKNQDANYSSSGTKYNTSGDFLEGASPEHATDNDQRYDSVLFSFNNAIDLNSVTIGWKGEDSDISLLAYTGVDAPVLNGKKYGDLVNTGWSFIGHYSNLATNVAKAVNAGNITSSYWLIGALNPLVGSTDWTKGNDYVKILALAGEISKVPPSGGVPEPGTLLLMGAGLFGLSRFNTRRLVRSAV